MFHKVRNHISLALIFLALTLGQQYGFYALKGYPITWLTFEKHLAMFAFFLFFTLAKGPKTRFFILSFIMILNFAQMAHLSYFGTQILPNEIFLLFSEMHEVAGVLTAELQHVLIPLAFTLVPLAIGYYFHRRLKTQFEFKIVPILLILYFLYNPVRTYVTGNTWGRQPSTRELTGLNVYLSLSYFMGRILPYKLDSKRYSLEQNESVKLKLTKGSKQEWDNVILVLGESLSPHHMSLFGYERSTTPYLDQLKNTPNFFHTIGLSAGVSTDISVAFFLNLGYGEAGGIKAAKGEHCIFRSAKKIGYSTHFLSAQSGQQLRYIAPYLCSAYLDDYRSLESVSPSTIDSNAVNDRVLLPKLSEVLNSGTKNFIMLHQRGSHGPWELRSTTATAKFKNKDTNQRINDYDNSVVEFDLFWNELRTILEKQKSKTLVIYLSDHGESVGENGRWGHGFLARNSFEVPVLIQSFNKELPARTKELFRYLPHYNLALYTTQALGWETNQSPFTIMKDYVIFGNDIDGFAGKAKVKFGILGDYEFQTTP
jgi:glucan phosphoethanolaminetransferase (alkaline phosphatase superfamily)